MYARPSTWLLFGVALMALAFELALVPISQELALAKNSATKARDDFQWMRANISVAVSAEPSSVSIHDPLNALEAALVRTGVRSATERIEREASTIVVTLSDADFGGVLKWLALCEQELGLLTESFRLAPGDKTGTVTGAVVITSGA